MPKSRHRKKKRPQKVRPSSSPPQPQPPFLLINSTEEKSLWEWQQLYPHYHLFLEVTAQNPDGSTRLARLIAATTDLIQLEELSNTYQARGLSFSIFWSESFGLDLS